MCFLFISLWLVDVIFLLEFLFSKCECKFCRKNTVFNTVYNFASLGMFSFEKLLGDQRLMEFVLFVYAGSGVKVGVCVRFSIQLVYTLV